MTDKQFYQRLKKQAEGYKRIYPTNWASLFICIYAPIGYCELSKVAYRVSVRIGIHNNWCDSHLLRPSQRRMMIETIIKWCDKKLKDI